MAELRKKEGSPYWYADFSVNGKRVKKSTGTRNKKDARQIADHWEKEARSRAVFGETHELTLAQAMGHWAAKHQTNPKARAEQRIAKILAAASEVEGMGPDMMFHDLTSTLLRRYQAARIAAGLSEQTVNHEINAMSAAYNLVKEDYRVRQNLSFPRFTIESTSRAFTDSEVARLLDELDPHKPLRAKGGGTYVIEDRFMRQQIADMRQQNYDLVVCLLDTGLRLMEMTRVTWEDVDTKTWSFEIERTKTKNQSITAGHRMMRVTPTARVREVLARRYQDRGNVRYVFPGWKMLKDGRKVRDNVPQSSTGAIRKAINAAGLNSPECVMRWRKRDVRSLRDTYATRLSANGVSLDEIQHLLGHSTPVMTAKYRDPKLDRFSARAADVLNGLD